VAAVNPCDRPTAGFWRGVGLLAALALLFSRPALAEPTEQEIKAALIFNITRFVEWPATSFRAPGAPLVVAILGQDEVSDVLEPMLHHKTVGGHPLEVRWVQNAADARGCQLLYVAASEERRVASILHDVRGQATLTVAGIDHFADQGGHINLVVEDQRVRVLVNPTSAGASHLKISAKLLSLARIVGGTP
jgi:hypothetical protein